MEDFVFDPIERTTPVIGLPTRDGEEVKLHYFNTRVRLFGQSGFNHIELRNGAETANPSVKAIIVSKKILDLLIENRYPAAFDPYVDPETKEVFDRFFEQEIGSLDSELDELQDGLDKPE